MASFTLNLEGPIEVLKVKNQKDDFNIRLDPVPDLPTRALIVGKSQISGKTNLLVNLMEHYQKYFESEDIYVFCKTAKSDDKWINLLDVLQVPDGNVHLEYSEEELSKVIATIKQNYETAIEEKRHPVHSLVILDDIAFDGSLRKHNNGAIDQLFSLGRHWLCSCIVIAQKYTMIDTTCRANQTAGYYFALPEASIKQLYDDIGLGMSYKEFKRLFDLATEEKHSYLVYNTNSVRERHQYYQNRHFGDLLVPK